MTTPDIVRRCSACQHERPWPGPQEHGWAILWMRGQFGAMEQRWICWDCAAKVRDLLGWPQTTHVGRQPIAPSE